MSELEKCVSVVNIKAGSISDRSRDPSTSKLILSGYVRRVTIKDNLAVNTIFPPSYVNKRELLFHQGPHQFTATDPEVSYSLDSNVRSEITEAYFLFLTWTDRSQLSGLLLSSTSESNIFNRIGTLRISGYGAIAAKYQVKQDVINRVEAWASFNAMLRACRGKSSGDDAIPGLAQLHLGTSATERLYDHDWTIDDSHMEELKLQDIVLQ
ncbi:MAG: hypothetical protein L6R42_003294 [Xanthoria sp. 1 TBL-2021]|nr:MAG: hypothetical protein L6R42_003294 [Xanthoria sp. 1 TBL-2021]